MKLTIEKLRKHKKEHQYIDIGTILDVQTINILLLVYDNLSKENARMKFRRMLYNNLSGLVNFCWKHTTLKYN